MNYIATMTKTSVRLLGMSTACANAADLANWLGVRGGNLFNFRHSVRPVPLELYIDGFPETKGFCPLMQSMNRPTLLAIKNHSPEKPVIVFVPSRRQTRLTARDLINLCGMDDNPRRFVHMDEEELQLHLTRVKDEALKEAISFGIGLHHAGLVDSDRQLSEELFLNNKIQVLVATSTLAWGVNLPAHLVVVKGTQFYDAKIEGYKDMDLTDVLQMLGRAGRPQFDNSGVARIFTQDAKKDFYKHFLHTGFPVESSLHNVLDNHLCAEVSAETILTKQDALDYLTWTFFFRRLHKNPSYYGLEISADEHSSTTAQHLANEYMIKLIDKSFAELEKSKCVETYPNGDVDPTPMGKIMSYYYLSHLTIRYFVRHARLNASFLDCLSWISHATEYDELPVRHNEDLINDELSRNMPFSAASFGMPMWDPHVKAFLLLQAHMSRIGLPITDYVGDQTSVLDQAIRVIQAAIDVLTELGYLCSVKQMIRLLQCIKSARWPTDPVMSILPGCEGQLTNKHRNAADKAPLTKLVDLATASDATLAELAKHLGIPTRQESKFLQTARAIPTLSLRLQDATSSSFVVSLKRMNPLTLREARMWAPRFPKPQTEGFFVVVSMAGGAGGPGELLAVRRVGWNANKGQVQGQSGTGVEIGAKLSARTIVKLPPGTAGKKVDVLIASDGYVGLEWRVAGYKVPETTNEVDVGHDSEGSKASAKRAAAGNGGSGCSGGWGGLGQ